MITSKEQLFAAYPKKSITLDLPDVEGISMAFHELSVKDKIDYGRFAQKEGITSLDLAGFVIARSADILTDDDAEMIMNRLSVQALGYCSKEILKLSGMSQEAQEEAEKN
tara:strand:- start:2340 stop:2669 length:330 start_codon:yes stop_codon:yes gene_type:complete